MINYIVDIYDRVNCDVVCEVTNNIVIRDWSNRGFPGHWILDIKLTSLHCQIIVPTRDQNKKDGKNIFMQLQYTLL